MKPRMDLYDKLPSEVREAMGDALAPWSAEYLYKQIQSGRSVKSVVDEIQTLDREQHRNAKMMGVVADSRSFKIRPWRKPRRIR
jgi:hypothetical protein